MGATFLCLLIVVCFAAESESTALGKRAYIDLYEKKAERGGGDTASARFVPEMAGWRILRSGVPCINPKDEQRVQVLQVPTT